MSFLEVEKKSFLPRSEETQGPSVPAKEVSVSGSLRHFIFLCNSLEPNTSLFIKNLRILEDNRNWIIFLSEVEARKSHLRDGKQETWGSFFWSDTLGCCTMGIESRSATIYLGNLGQTYPLGSHSVTLPLKGKELSGMIFEKSDRVLNAVFLWPLIIVLQTLSRAILCSP